MYKYIITLLSFILVLTGNVKGQEIYENEYQWQIPGGNYIDATSFFSLHGYVNAVFAGESAEWTDGAMNGIGMPGQVLIPNTNKSSFQTDEALWISSEISSKTSLLMELHLVTSPSGVGAAGPGGLTFVLTEANAKFKVYKNLANIAIGTFWNPFGIHNNDWLGAQNQFTMIPYASSAFPSHFNEKGIRLDGFFGKKDKIGGNYVISLGNGYNAFDISGYGAVDQNDNKTISARASLFPLKDNKLNVGASFAAGLLSEGDATIGDSLPGYYDFSFQSFGADAILKIKDLKFRTYLISTTKNYNSNGANYSSYSIGSMAEISNEIMLNKFKY
ncbi:MAG: hypothetical protein JKY54_18055, partial [Flavobacteriales bacterium]|nr:hypothetical protein [Flavobacteriales bacterium]